MKILLLARSESTHIQKWSKALKTRGFEVAIFDFFPVSTGTNEHYKDIPIFSVFNKPFDTSKESSINKFKYLKALPKLKKVIRDFQPDIVHAHYASSYGVLGALSHFSPFFLSVWGSDIFSFPKRSLLHKLLLKFALKKADRIFSTSQIMREEAAKYSSKNIEVIPFGIDLQKFQPSRNRLNEEIITLGCFKVHHPIYGINNLIQVFHSLLQTINDKKLHLLLAGDGPQHLELKQLVAELKIQNNVTFLGYIEPGMIPEQIQKTDIVALLSRAESFGVSAIEASACEKPVIATNVGGLPEVIEHDITGLLVPLDNHAAAVKAFSSLILSSEMRKEMGRNGRKFVKEKYDWNKNVESMISHYQSTNQ